MKITVHRATNLIGGGVTEYDSNGWKLFVDSGKLQPGVVVYTPDFIEYSEYLEGGHEPGSKNYQEKYAFSPGDRVLAIIGNELLMPCTLIGPTSEEFFKEKYRKCGAAEDKIDEFVSQLWDWEWDTVVVKPLVKIDIGSGEMPSEITAQRIYVFPYKELEL